MYETAKAHFIATVKKADPKYAYLLLHIPLVEKWAQKLLTLYPEADSEIVLLGVWLHDIGQVVGNTAVDHAVNSEIEAIRFLGELDAQQETIEKVAHCVRAHRCSDVPPDTIEAKLVAAADSASHMIDIIYINMFNRGEYENAFLKLESDFHDMGCLPQLQKELQPLYEAWKNLLNVYPKLA